MRDRFRCQKLFELPVKLRTMITANGIGFSIAGDIFFQPFAGFFRSLFPGQMMINRLSFVLDETKDTLILQTYYVNAYNMIVIGANWVEFLLDDRFLLKAVTLADSFYQVGGNFFSGNHGGMPGCCIIGGVEFLIYQMDDQRLFFLAALISIVYRRVISFIPGFKIFSTYLSDSLSRASTHFSKTALPSPSV